jgi:hypothetical protein
VVRCSAEVRHPIALTFVVRRRWRPLELKQREGRRQGGGDLVVEARDLVVAARDPAAAAWGGDLAIEGWSRWHI